MKESLERQPSPQEAARALEAMRGAARRARPFELPLWYHAAFGAVMAGCVAAQALRPPHNLLATVMVLAVVPWLVRYMRRVTGRALSGLRWGRTLPLGLAMVALAWACSFAVMPGPGGREPVLSVWQGAFITFVIAALADWLWVRVYRAETRGEL